ncbi:hypothetical protein [Modestobacter versicolor]|nr:hypothetical protein [Modestobacter versicolor]MBB3675851.1 hypothetical protein [Modestobacter versicolor]
MTFGLVTAQEGALRLLGRIPDLTSYAAHAEDVPTSPEGAVEKVRPHQVTVTAIPVPNAGARIDTTTKEGTGQ